VRFRHPSQRLQPAAERARYHNHNNDLKDPGYRRFLQPLLDALKPHLNAHAHGLDFGCGPGPLLAEMLREQGFHCALYDPLFHPTPPAADARFDFITSTEVVEHLFNPLAEFRRLRGWLKPGGWLALMTALVEPPVDFGTWYYRRDPTHVVFYSRRSLEWMASTLGFADLTWSGERVVVMRRPE
jgi:2-polyprenyl-3-methyl-5-hydroxy-6-metoxy-1,4-benzoquinol methylase